mmetsp:Transcript_25469/g.73061  ORF Transcript_25469/g.73061 Transcript_25469/m.73061 type:complete len:249 (-) Transcript_25469:1076-1822(-)
MFLALLLICIPGLGGRWRRTFGVSRVVRRHLRQDWRALQGHDPGARDASRRGGRCNLPAHVLHDAVLRRELTLGRGLVKIRRIELGQAVGCNLNELLCCTICSHGVSVLGMLLLAHLRGLCNLLVQRNTSLVQCLDVLRKGCDGASGLLNGLPKIRCLEVQRLVLVLGLVQLRLAVRLLLVVGHLLLGEQGHHVVDHLEDLVERAGVTTDGHGDEVHPGVPAAVLAVPRLQDRERTALDLLAGDLGLQ